MKKTKTFTFGMEWKVCGNQCIEVPVDFNQEQVEEYVKEHWEEINLPTKHYYVDDSAEPVFECSDFEEDE